MKTVSCKPSWDVTTIWHKQGSGFRLPTGYKLEKVILNRKGILHLVIILLLTSHYSHYRWTIYLFSPHYHQQQSNLCVSRGVKQTVFRSLYFYFWVRRYNKTLNDWLRGTQRLLFAWDPRSRWNKTYCYSLGPVIKCLLSFPAVQDLKQLLKFTHENSSSVFVLSMSKFCLGPVAYQVFSFFWKKNEKNYFALSPDQILLKQNFL